MGVVLLAGGMARADAVDMNEEIKTFCARKWPTDYRTQKYCRERQYEGAASVKKFLDRFPTNSERGLLVVPCEKKWTQDGLRDWSRINHCLQEQYKAFLALEE